MDVPIKNSAAIDEKISIKKRYGWRLENMNLTLIIRDPCKKPFCRGLNTAVY
jgi:hypothetical protein